MHEWALAEAVISTTLKEAKRSGFKEVSLLEVLMGELQQIDLEIFELALKELATQHPILKGMKIDFSEVKVVFKCNICSKCWSFKEASEDLDGFKREAIHFVPELSHTYFRCPKCKSPDFSFAKGRGVGIGKIEGE